MKFIEPVAHLIPEIKDLFEQKSWGILKDLINDIRPEDMADSWYHFSSDERLGLFKLLDAQKALIFFESLELSEQKELIGALDDEKIAPLLEGIPPSDVAELFHTLPKKVVNRMVKLVHKHTAVKRIELLMEFEPDTAGALLHPEFIKIHPKMTTRSALAVIHSIGRMHQRKHLWALYVTSSQGELLGALTLQDLIASAPDASIADIMVLVDHFKLPPDVDQEHVASLFAKYDLLSAPVIDENNHLLGIIIVDDVLDVIKEEASEDIAKLVGSNPDEFQEKSIFRIAWYRSPWLFATLIGQFLLFLVIHRYENLIIEIVALASFLPLIPAMGGNVGAQSAMILVRNMATGKLRGKNKLFVILREAGIGTLLGAFYGALTGIIAYVFYGQIFGFEFCFLVAISLFAAMVVAATVGAIGPIVLEKLGIDPATAVAPMVTTTTDLLGISIYFYLAVHMLLDKATP
ncbi:MAG: magnesium transporter [Candidatus Omnitrophota bacterium]|jgi:magnesium transporter